MATWATKRLGLAWGLACHSPRPARADPGKARIVLQSSSCDRLRQIAAQLRILRKDDTPLTLGRAGGALILEAIDLGAFADHAGLSLPIRWQRENAPLSPPWDLKCGVWEETVTVLVPMMPGENQLAFFQRACSLVADAIEGEADRLANNDTVPPPLDKQGRGGENGESSTRNTGTRRGRPQDTDPKADARVFDAWQTGNYKKFADLARELKIERRDVKLAIDRERKRRDTKASE